MTQEEIVNQNKTTMKEQIEKLIEKYRTEIITMKQFIEKASGLSKPFIKSNIKSKEDIISDLENLLKSEG